VRKKSAAELHNFSVTFITVREFVTFGFKIR